MAKRIDSFTDAELKAMEDRAEEQMREALQRVMDAVVARIVLPAPRSIRTLTAANGCVFCLSPRHPGPCAKPKVGDAPAEGSGHPRRKGLAQGGPASPGANRTGGSTEVRPSLREAKTTDDVERATRDEIFKISGQHTRVDFAGSDVQIAREHSEGLLAGMERHPHVRIDEIGMSSTSSYGEAIPHYNYESGELTHSIHFGTATSNDPHYRADLKREYDTGYAVTAHPGGVASHEFGHAAMQQSPTYTSQATVDAALKYSGKRGRYDVAVTDISIYGGTNDQEMGAEAFADVIQNGDGASDMSRAIYAAMGSGS